METLLWLEQTGFSTWMRESGPGFFGSLILHSVGMAFLVGVHVATDLRVLGFAPGVPLSLMGRFRPVASAGLVVVVASGLLLLAAYPTKALTNWVFYLKLGAVAAALLVARSLSRTWLRSERRDTPRPFAGRIPVDSLPVRAKVLAGFSLALWAGAITSGRLLAYTYDVLFAADVLLYGP